MKCTECEYFKITAQPIKVNGTTFDFGTAVCNKHDLVCDFRSELKLKKLRCVEDKK